MEHVALDLDLKSSNVGDIEGLFKSGGTFLQKSWVSILELTGEFTFGLILLNGWEVKSEQENHE